jgi:predicted HicB family RNase H-like nuclease
VAEVATYCEYQIKVKEQEFLDRMKEVTDACNHQLEESQLKMEASLQERVEKVGYNLSFNFQTHNILFILHDGHPWGIL